MNDGGSGHEDMIGCGRLDGGGEDGGIIKYIAMSLI